MGDRIARQRLILAQLPAAPPARQRPVLNNPIRVSDQLAMTALMARLPTLFLARRTLPRALLPRLARVPRRRQAAVLRAPVDQPPELGDLRLQRGDPLSLRGEQNPHCIPASIERFIRDVRRHERNISCNTRKPFKPTRRPPERLPDNLAQSSSVGLCR